jgi:hypothetical protein
VRTNHPDEVLVLYEDDTQTGFVDSEETLPLLAQRVDEYVAEGTTTLETGEAFMDAWVAGDGDAVAALFAADGKWEVLDAEQLPALHDWYRALGGSFQSEGCALRRLYVQCDSTFESDLTRFLGAEPVANLFVFYIEDGAITRVNDPSVGRVDEVWEAFHEWVTTNHPDDVELMYSADGDLPVLDATSIELWERYVDEFVDG